MVYVRWKTKKKEGTRYAYLVHNVREGTKVKQKSIVYLGRFPVVTKEIVLQAGKSVGTTIDKKKLEESFNKKFTDTSKWNENKFYKNMKLIREERGLNPYELGELIGPVLEVGTTLFNLEEYIDNPEKAKERALMFASFGMKFNRNNESAKKQGKRALNYDDTMKQSWKEICSAYIKFTRDTPDFVSLCKVAKKLENKKILTKEKELEKLRSINYSKISDLDLWKNLQAIRELYGIKIKDFIWDLSNEANWYEKDSYKNREVCYSKYERKYDTNRRKDDAWFKNYGKKHFDKKGNYIAKDNWDKKNKRFIDACRKTLKVIQKDKKE